MDIKKILTIGASAALVSMMAACSEDPSPTGADTNLSSGTVAGGKSSSSKGGSNDVMDENATYVSISEIMYNAPEKINGVDASSLEWVELTIVKGENIRGMAFDSLHLSGAVSYTFPNDALNKGEYIVVTNDPDLFKQVYPSVQRVYGPWEIDPKTKQIAKLSNEGDVIDVKIKGKGDMSCAFSSEPPWTSLADGKGRSLVFISGNPAQSSAWGASVKVGGNPGSGEDAYIKPSAVRLNEIQPFNLSAGEDGWVELYNSGAEDVDVTGWKFKSKYQDSSWTISAGVVPAKGYLVLDPMDVATFGEKVYLNPKGGEYYLYEVVGGEKTGVESSLMLAASYLSSGIVEVSDGSISQGAMIKATPGEANAALQSGPIYINEIYYHPPEAPSAGEVSFEYLELINKSDAPVKLYESKDGKSKGWKIEGVNMEFPATAEIPAGGLMLVISSTLKGQESAFRTTYNIPATVPFAFYDGKLSNRGEMIAVKKPFEYDFDDNKQIQWYYDWSDATLYSDSWEGFKLADGYGKSLQRKNFESMGYEVSSWEIADPTPGR